ncbi:MAG TPA: MgtC/SapB family protein [Candidatus Omnitrophota bacterium]|jgi:putative Mg2+ transporter-C (MgtC) family protein|nr:MgtC/SapB family protein [Candidatus Omnitrophota bacterium]
MHALMDELRNGLMVDWAQLVRIAVRLLLSAGLGAVVGLQREQTGKPAGLRTHMLVALGATLFVLAPLEMDVSMSDIGRVIQGVATGIGFIGGGAILKLSAEREVRGLTSAAGIWITAAAGVAVGLGRLAIAAVSILLTWIILAIIGRAERRIERNRDGERKA